MQEEFSRHNLFLKGLDVFTREDPHLANLRNLSFVDPLDWWKKIDWKYPGIFILTGGRQIGKSTSTKLLIKHVLEQKIFQPQAIFYLTCDLIQHVQDLTRLLRNFLEEPSSKGERFLLIVDEVTFVKDWDRAIKALADEGVFRHGFCLLTGSDSLILKEAANRFPGRRGSADQTDFHLYPLSFKRYIELTDTTLLQPSENDTLTEKLFGSLEKYFRSGGYLRAINELHQERIIRPATYQTFEQWICGDLEKRGKDRRTLLLVLKTLYETTGSQVTFSSLANRMGEISKETFINYVERLERMDVVFQLQAFDQNKKMGFPKKARKVHFADPFLHDTVGQWLTRERLAMTRDETALKAEMVVAANLRRESPCYYWKGTGEIDVIRLRDSQIHAIEVKWTGQLRTQDLKELKKFPHARIAGRQKTRGVTEGIPIIPLPLLLLAD